MLLKLVDICFAVSFQYFSALHFYSMVWKHQKQTSSFAKMLVLLNGNGSARYGLLSKDKRGYSHLKKEALDRTMWRARFGRGFGPVVRQTTE
jgi:hypothetical protein